jgi:hypothetical protein
MSEKSQKRDPVVEEAAEQWHKFLLLLMLEHGLTEFEITEAMVQKLAMLERQCLVLDARHERYILRRMSTIEAEKFARGAVSQA